MNYPSSNGSTSHFYVEAVEPEEQKNLSLREQLEEYGGEADMQNVQDLWTAEEKARNLAWVQACVAASIARERVLEALEALETSRKRPLAEALEALEASRKRLAEARAAAKPATKTVPPVSATEPRGVTDDDVEQSLYLLEYNDSSSEEEMEVERYQSDSGSEQSWEDDSQSEASD